MQGKRKRKSHKSQKGTTSEASNVVTQKKKRTLRDSLSDQPGAHDFFGLDETVILQILSKLEIHELCRCALVCSHWRRFSTADYLWQRFYGQHTGIWASSWRELCSIKYQETHGIDALKETLCSRKRITRRSLLYIYPLDRKYTAPGLEYQKLYESVFKVSKEGLKSIFRNEVESLLNDEETLNELKPTAANWLRSYMEDQLEELTYKGAKDLVLDLLKYEGDYDSQGFPVQIAKRDPKNPELESNEDVKDFTKIKERVMGLLHRVTQDLDVPDIDSEEDASQGLGLQPNAEEQEEQEKKEEKEEKEEQEEKEEKKEEEAYFPLHDCRRRWFSDDKAQKYAAWLMERFPSNRARFCQIGPVWPVFRYYVTGILCISNRYFALYWVEANPTYPIE